MEYYNNILCVSHTELVDKIIPMTTYVNLYNRKKFRVVRRGCYGTSALIDFNSLPQCLKDDIKEKYGDPKELAVINPLKRAWEIDTVAANFYSTWTLPNGQNLSPEKIKEYTATASALNAIHKLLNERQVKRKALGGSTRNLLDTIIASVKALQKEYGYVLPGSSKRLKLRLSEYQKDGYVSLISGKYCNDNSAKVANDEQQATLRKLLRDHRNLDNVQVATLYNIIANNLNWKTITAKTVAKRREEWELTTYSGRRGETAFNNTKAMQVKRSAPKHPLLYWTMDGWDVELLYQKSEVTKDGRTITTYHNRLTVVVVLDACCKYPIGYAIGTHETPDLIRSALRNGIDHTVEVFNERYKPHQLQTDQYGNRTLKPFYEAAAALYTPARVKNAKTKVIEPYFKRLNKKYCQLLPNWSGFGMDAKKESQPNEEYLNKIRHSFPTQEECIKQIKRMILLERKEKYTLYKELWNELPSDKKLRFDDVDYLYSLGETTGYTNRIQPQGLPVAIMKLTRTYDSFDISFRKHEHVDWVVRYNPSDLSAVLATNADGTIRFMLQEKYVQPMALAERVNGDAAELKAIRDFNDNMKNEIIQEMTQDYEIVNDLFVRNPQLNDTLAKLVLVDSMGQHKDRKSESRIGAAAKRITAKQEQKQIQQEQKTFSQEQQEYINSKVDLSQYL
jgi:hypothetical protein